MVIRSFLHRNKIYLIISSLFTLVHYGLGFGVFYQPDIYLSMDDPLGLVNDYIYPGGRVIAALIYWFIRKICHSYDIFFYVSSMLSFLVMIISITCFAEMIDDNLIKPSGNNRIISTEICVGIVSCLTVANLFSYEFFLYSNSTVGVVFDILLCVLASRSFIRAVEGDCLAWNSVIILFCLLIAVFIYEPPLAVFVITTTLFTIVKRTNLVSFIRRQAEIAAFYGTAMMIKLIFTKCVINSVRTQFDVPSLYASAEAYAPSGELPIVFILDRITFGMWIFMVACILIFVMIAYTSVINGRNDLLIKAVYVSFVTVIMGVLPYIFRLSNDYRPRIYYPLGMLFGVLFFFTLVTGILDKKEEYYDAIVLFIVIPLCLVQWMNFVKVYNDQYITNYDDKILSQMIGECIDEYESKNNQTIKYVSFYSDAVRKKYINSNGYCITQRAYDSEWSKLSTLNFYLERSYMKGKVDENVGKYFAEHNWDCFSTDQLVFEGDTVHVCTF